MLLWIIKFSHFLSSFSWFYLTMLSSPLISHFVYFVRLFYLFIYLLFISYLLTLIWSLNSDDQIANHPNSRPSLVSAPRHPPHPPPPRRAGVRSSDETIVFTQYLVLMQ